MLMPCEVRSDAGAISTQRNAGRSSLVLGLGSAAPRFRREQPTEPHRFNDRQPLISVGAQTGKETMMIAQVKSKPAFPHTVDVYLGFEIIQKDDKTFVAIPRGWTQGKVAVLQATDLPTMRKRIWAWWHHLLD